MARQHPRTIAYLRVSTHEQDVAKNQTDILLLAHRKQLFKQRITLSASSALESPRERDV
jgi:DNA invertase Pin-like site-specific DNA recombinase